MGRQGTGRGRQAHGSHRLRRGCKGIVLTTRCHRCVLRAHFARDRVWRGSLCALRACGNVCGNQPGDLQGHREKVSADTAGNRIARFGGEPAGPGGQVVCCSEGCGVVRAGHRTGEQEPVGPADVLAAYAAVMEAAEVAGVSQASVAADVRELVAANGKGGAFVGRALGRLLEG
jgi:hypothetical protein